MHDLDEAQYEIELRANGRIVGRGEPCNTGLDGALPSGLAAPFIPLSGRWAYHETAGTLALELHTKLRGEEHFDVLTLQASGRTRIGDDWVEARARRGYPWRFKRTA